MELLVGLSLGSCSFDKLVRTASMPSLLGMLVYKLVTSRVAIMECFGKVRPLMMFGKCPLSRT